MIRRRIIVILCFIVLLPLVIYISSEFTSTSENEKLVEEIFQQQMNFILKEINKNAWDVAGDWTNKIDRLIIESNEISSEEINKFLSSYKYLKAVLVSDTNIETSNFYSRQPDVQNRELIADLLRKNQNQIKRLINRKNIGYEKLEPIAVGDRGVNSDLLLLHLTESPQGDYLLASFLIDINIFIKEVIQPNFNELARNEFIIALFNKDNNEPVFSTADVKNYKVQQNKRVWLLPGYYIGIALKENKIEDLVKSRFRRSMILISVLTLVLIASVLYLFRNISKQMELAKMKTDFVSNVSHELRTPLALIRMFAETIEMGRTENDAEIKEFSRIINNESERLTLLINRILDFSKIESGDKKYTLRKIDINKVVSDIIVFYTYHLEKNGFALIHEIQDGELNIKGDKDAVSETLVNLIDNAMKYSKENKQITIRTWSKNGSVFIEVEDKGIGVPENLHKKIFEKFYQVENRLTTGRKGSGLGLSIVAHIMDVHNGNIKLFSKPGEGSCFRLEFPKISK